MDLMVRTSWCTAVFMTSLLAGCAAETPGGGPDASTGEAPDAASEVEPDDDADAPSHEAIAKTLASTSMTGERTAAVVSELSVTLSAGQTVVFQTTALTSGADPVMSVLTAAGVEVAADNDGAGGKNALIVYTPATSGIYKVLVRARTSISGGTCTVAQNGAPKWTNVAFSGAPTLVSSLRAKETLETVRLPNGAAATQVIYVLKGDGIGIERRALGGGTSGGALLSFTTTPGSKLVLYAVRAGTPGGQLGWVRNDAAISGHDTDKDGLGNELEAAIGTCSTPTGTVTGPDGEGFDCALTADPRDTDGDGISDAWELVGRRDATPHQPLPLWGANPRHKDVFLEVDFLQLKVTENDIKMEPANALKMAAIYADQIETWHPLLQLAHAVSLRNPDRKPGISLHLDTGVAPADPSHATIYGNWGGHNVLACAVQSDGSCTKQVVEDVWRDQMSSARRGIFHYAGGFQGLAASTGEYLIYSTFAQNSLRLPAHEFGHSLGFGHSGRTGNNGDPDANCKPGYPSHMNYAYFDENGGTTNNVGFSDGLSRGPINNVSVPERGFTSDARYLLHLREVFEYNVDAANGHVDWNRDGVFSTTPVRAYTNFRPGGQGCEWTRYNKVAVGGSAGTGTPALGHLGTRTYALYTHATTGQLMRSWTTSTTSTGLNFECPNLGDCDGVTFSTPSARPLDASAGLAAIRLRLGGVETLLVVVNDSSGRLWETRLSVSGGVEQWTAPVQINTVLAQGEPTLAADGTALAYVAFKGTDGRIRTNRFSGGGWQGEQQARTLDGVPSGFAPVPLPAMSAMASPGLGYTYMPGFVGRHLFGAFANGVGAVDLWRFDPVAALWTKTTALPDRPVIRRRPSMAWVPSQRTAEWPGTFYLGYLASDSPTMPFDEPRFVRSFTTLTSAGAVERVGLLSPFDNNGTNLVGIALSYDASIDVNLRALVVKPNGVVEIRPNADGITGFTQRAVNDWEWLSMTTCRTLIFAENGRGNTVDPALSSPIKCRPYVYTPN